MVSTYARDEAAETARDLLGVLQSQPVTDKARRAADFRRICSAARSLADDALRAGTLVDQVVACFDAARAAGIGYKGLGNVRAAAYSYVTGKGPAASVRLLILRLALVNEAMASATVELRSRAEAEEMLARFNAAFDPAIDAAADAGEGDVYRGLRSVHASVVRRLLDDARPLPQLITYRFAKSMPSLVLAHRLYGDASRQVEIVEENRIMRPAFSPAEGKALSK